MIYMTFMTSPIVILALLSDFIVLINSSYVWIGEDHETSHARDITHTCTQLPDLSGIVCGLAFISMVGKFTALWRARS